MRAFSNAQATLNLRHIVSQFVFVAFSLKGMHLMCTRRPQLNVLKVTFALIFVLTVAGLGISEPAQATTIADFQFDGSSPASVDAGSSWNTTDISAGAGLAPLNISAIVGNPTPAIENTYGDIEPTGGVNVTLPLAITDDIYYSFSVSPAADTKLSFTELAFDYFSSGSTQATAHVFSSIDGFTDSDVILSYTDASGAGTGFENVVVDLSAYTGITTSTEFRIYLSRPVVGNTANVVQLDNLLLTAVVTPPVPEPNSLMLLTLGLFGLLNFARKRRGNCESK